MLANFEKRVYEGKEQVWTGRYRGLTNLPHWHLECELIYTELGQLRVSHNQTEYLLQQGDAIFLESGEIHYIKSDSDSVAAVIMFDADLLQDMKQYHLKNAKLSHSYAFSERFEEIHRELTLRPPFFELQSCQSVLSLMIEIFRGEEIIEKSSDLQSSSIQKYKGLLSEIEEKYSYITFSDAAAFMGLSEPYFSKYFHKISGMTFSRYLNLVRLEHAITLLKADGHLSVTEIALQCGFDTIRHFNRVFKDATGMTPSRMPRDYVLNAKPIRTIRDAFDPTLQTSELLT